MTAVLSLEWAMLRGWRGAFLAGLVLLVLARVLSGPLTESVAQVVLWLLPATYALVALREARALHALIPRTGDWPLRRSALLGGHLLVWIPVGVAVASVVAWLLYRSSYVPDAARAWSFAAVLSGAGALGLYLIVTMDLDHAGRSNRLISIGFRVLAGLFLVRIVDQIAQGQSHYPWWFFAAVFAFCLLVEVVRERRGSRRVEFLPTPSPKPVLTTAAGRAAKEKGSRPEPWWRRRDAAGMRKARATRSRTPLRTIAWVTGSAPVWGLAATLLVVAVLVLSDATGDAALAVISLYAFALAHLAVGYALRAWSWLRTTPIQPARVIFANQLPVVLVFALLVFAAFYANHVRMGDRGPRTFVTPEAMKPYLDAYPDRPRELIPPDDGVLRIYGPDLIRDEVAYFVASTRWLYRNYYAYDLDPEDARACLGEPDRFQDYPQPYEAYTGREDVWEKRVFRWILWRARVVPRDYLPIHSPADLAPLKANGEVYDLHTAVTRLWARSRGAVRFAAFLTTALGVAVWTLVTLASICVFLRPGPTRWTGPLVGGLLLTTWMGLTWHPVMRSVYTWHVSHAWLTLPVAAALAWLLARRAAHALLRRPPTAPSR